MPSEDEAGTAARAGAGPQVCQGHGGSRMEHPEAALSSQTLAPGSRWQRSPAGAQGGTVPAAGDSAGDRKDSGGVGTVGTGKGMAQARASHRQSHPQAALSGGRSALAVPTGGGWSAGVPRGAQRTAEGWARWAQAKASSGWCHSHPRWQLRGGCANGVPAGQERLPLGSCLMPTAMANRRPSVRAWGGGHCPRVGSSSPQHLAPTRGEVPGGTPWAARTAQEVG